MPRRAVSFYLPTWPIDRWRRIQRRQEHNTHDRHEPIFVVDSRAQQRIVVSCCLTSRHAGVELGMTLAHARALVTREPVIVPHRPDHDAAALLRLARWATFAAPVVAPDQPDGVIMNLTGCDKVFPSPHRWLDAMIARFAHLGINVRTAIAPTFTSARALARYAPDSRTIVDEDGVRDALEPLPINAVTPDPNAINFLLEVGIERVGQLLDVPRDAIPSRFGNDVLLRIDQMLGEAIEVVEPVRPPSIAHASLYFTGPTNHRESIEVGVREAIERMTKQLRRRVQGVRVMRITMKGPDIEPIRIEMRFTRPSANEAHLWKLMRTRLEKVDYRDGIETIDVRAVRVGRMTQPQRTLHDQGGGGGGGGGPENERAHAELMDTLVDRLGPDRVVRIAMRESHVPERVYHERSVREQTRHIDVARRPGGDRPSILYDKPMPSDVMALAPDGPPCWMRFEQHETVIVASIGPERIGSEWWGREWNELERRSKREVGSPACLVYREYYKVQTAEGHWYWIFRHQPTARWFVHGEWA